MMGVTFELYNDYRSNPREILKVSDDNYGKTYVEFYVMVNDKFKPKFAIQVESRDLLKAMQTIVAMQDEEELKHSLFLNGEKKPED